MASRVTFGESIYHGWYAYIEDGVFVIGRIHAAFGGDKYRGEYKGEDTPYLNELKENYLKAYNKIIKYFNRECANCGRHNGWNGCGEYVESCMQDYDAHSNWIPKVK